MRVGKQSLLGSGHLGSIGLLDYERILLTTLIIIDLDSSVSLSHGLALREAMLRLVVAEVDRLRVIDHVMGPFSHLTLYGKGILDSVGNSSVKSLLHVLLYRLLLDFVELVLVQHGLADVEAIHFAAVAVVAETEVMIVAVEAEPVADSLSQCFLCCSISRYSFINFNLFALNFDLI